MPDRALRSATIATCVSLAILLSLGTWQLQRLRWKQRLLADIAHAEQSPPVPLGETPAPFAKVFVEGDYMPLTALYGAEVRDAANGRPRMGAQCLQVLRRQGAAPLLVDRGWVADDAAPPPAAGPARVEGYVRAADHPGWLSADDDPVRHHFYTLDPQAIGKALGVTPLAPFTLIAMGAAPPGDTPVPAAHLPQPPNNHLQYAFTWFGLAAALLGVFTAWALGRRRRVAG